MIPLPAIDQLAPALQAHSVSFIALVAGLIYYFGKVAGDPNPVDEDSSGRQIKGVHFLLIFVILPIASVFLLQPSTTSIRPLFTISLIINLVVPFLYRQLESGLFENVARTKHSDKLFPILGIFALACIPAFVAYALFDTILNDSENYPLILLSPLILTSYMLSLTPLARLFGVTGAVFPEVRITDKYYGSLEGRIIKATENYFVIRTKDGGHEKEMFVFFDNIKTLEHDR
ncbi:MAG: hypothetical protein HY516_01195 [Candidatus Aenigmarchaeota archaeon]|nr:hypothetical protein [Candidatus Aenigmarchaeota archaeon]